MDIMQLSSSWTGATLVDQVSLKVLDMAMEQNEVLSEGMAKVMEASVNPSVGGNIDISV